MKTLKVMYTKGASAPIEIILADGSGVYLSITSAMMLKNNLNEAINKFELDLMLDRNEGK